METRRVEVTTWHLEMLELADLRPVPAPSDRVRVVQAEVPSPELSRFLYTAVGGDWYWTNRLLWDYDRWSRYVERPEIATWVAYVAGTPAGYAELETHPEGDVEITQFGLLPSFIGQRLGGHLLSIVVQKAWEGGARRVWLHTCTLDGPHARANYQARGFRVFKIETVTAEITAAPPGPWPGAHPARA